MENIIKNPCNICSLSDLCIDGECILDCETCKSADECNGNCIYQKEVK